MVELLVQYFRKSATREKKGVFLAFLFEDYVYIGYSLCKKPDIFDPNNGKAVAMGRASKYANYSYLDVQNLIPQSMYMDFLKFLVRCKKYYKDAKMLPWVIGILVDEGLMSNDGELLVDFNLNPVE